MTSKEKAIQIVRALAKHGLDIEDQNEIGWLVKETVKAAIEADYELWGAIIELAASGSLAREYGVAICEK